MLLSLQLSLAYHNKKQNYALYTQISLRFLEMPATLTESKIHFHFLEGGAFNLSQRLVLKSFIEGLFKREKKRLGELHYIFCTDDYLLGINQQYLQHDYYTDIITLPYQNRVNLSAQRSISV